MACGYIDLACFTGFYDIVCPDAALKFLVRNRR